MSNSFQERMNVLGRPKRFTNQLQAGIMTFLATKQSTTVLAQKDFPKRYTRYGSLLLLGPTFPMHSVLWTEFFMSLNKADRTDLFRNIVEAFKDSTLTHVAINAPIALARTGIACEGENVIRSPTGLQPVYGDFGPGIDVCDEQCPTQHDLEVAYWTQTVQVSSIFQVWAPRWTMFSRGNLSEKVRILQGSHFPGLDEPELGQNIEDIEVLDFYVGIGYFAFCYLARGAARVWGWEINGWSVEGLRRGCNENGWGVRVLRIDDHGNAADGEIERLVNDIRHLHDTTNIVRCIVFWGDNKWAKKIMGEVGLLMNMNCEHALLNVRHCNLGLLPTSQRSWEGAVQILNPLRGGWLHVHENVETSGIDSRRLQILQMLQHFTHRNGKDMFEAVCCHVEQVKTYAPGVVHCVYDIKIYPSR